jgi:hypothetical protein
MENQNELSEIEQKYLKLKQQRYEAVKRYQAKNKDKLLASQKVLYTQNREQILEARKAKYALKKDDEAFKQANREKSKASYYKKKELMLAEQLKGLVNEAPEVAVDV